MTLRPLTAITAITVTLLALRGRANFTVRNQRPLPLSAPPQNAPAEQRMINASADPLLAPFRFRSIGPASMGGRIDDIAVAESDPNIIYLGYAVGGVFKSVNNGTTWEPVFDEQTTASIGDIAIHPTNADIVYVGTGEPNNRQTLVVRRRHLQIDRRRQDLAEPRPP